MDELDRIGLEASPLQQLLPIAGAHLVSSQATMARRGLRVRLDIFVIYSSATVYAAADDTVFDSRIGQETLLERFCFEWHIDPKRYFLG